MAKIISSKTSEPQSLRVLIIEDSDKDVALEVRALSAAGYQITYAVAETAAEMKAALAEQTFDIVISDHGLPQFDAPGALAVLKQSGLDIPIIIVSGTIGEETAVECMRLGAHDYIMKNNLSRLCPAIARELEEADSRRKRKQAEDALHKSEILYKALFDDAKDGIALADAETGRLLDCNQSLCQMVERDKAELVGQPQSFLHPPATVIGRFSQTFQQHKAGDPGLTVQELLLSKNGKLIPVEIRAAIIRIHDRDFLMGIFRDITERKRAEDVLKESEERYRALFDRSLDLIYIINFEGRFIDANNAALNRLGYTREDIPSLNFADFLSEDQLLLAVTTLQEIRETGIHRNMLELRLRHKDGSDVYVETRGSTVMSNGKPVAIQSIARDVTEHKRAEAELLESKALIEAVVENVPLMIFLKEATDLRFVIFNRAGEELLGYDRSDLIGKNNLDLFPPEQASHFMAKDREVLDGEVGMLDIPEEPILTARKGQRLLHTRKICIRGADGVTKYLLGISEDITERKKAEEALRESEDRYRSLYVDSRDAIMILSPDRGFIAGNPAAIKLFACRDEQDFMARTQVSLSPEYQPDGERSADKARKMTHLALEKGAHFFEWMHRRADGSAFPATVLLSRIENCGSQLLQATVRDITELKQVEDALKESENKYRLLAENVNDVIFVLDMNLNYTYISPSVRILRGYEPEEILKRPSIETLAPSSRDLVMRSLSEIMEIEKSGRGDMSMSWTFELEMMRKDGGTVWTEVKFSLIRDKNQQAVGIMGLTRDITERRQVEDRTRKALGATVQAIAVIVETRDPYTAGHQRRVANLARAIAIEMILPINQIEGISIAAAIHDLGKISIPAEILSKPTKLTNIEFSLVKTHSQAGHDILKDIEFPWPIARIVLEHHERMNGSGYPHGLTGDNILLEARIIAVADVVESMGSHRPYRPSLGIEAALEEIEKNKGIFYDNAVADACLKLFREKGYQLAGA